MRTSRALVVPALALLLAACGSPDSREVTGPINPITYEEASRGSAETSGIYGLTAIDNVALPVAMGVDRGCVSELTGGELDLREDGTYRMRLASHEVCGGEAEAPSPHEDVLAEGLYSLQGFELRFGDKMVISNQDHAPETIEDPSGVARHFLPGERMAAVGSIRVDRVTFTLDDLRTYTFVRN